MATLEQIGEALKRADAAGDTAGARQLALAYRSMQSQANAGPPAGAAPGSREYADWAAAQARAGKALPQVSPTPPSATRETPNLANSTLATIGGITGSIPGLNQASDALLATGQTIGDIFSNQPGTVSGHYADIQKRRQAMAEAAPLANTLGGLGGTIGLTAGIGAVPAGAEALGMTGSFGKQLLNSALSSAGYEGLQGLFHGHTGGQLLADEGIGGLSGGAGSAIGQGLNKIGEGISNAVTARAQNALVDKAIQSAPSASDLFDTGSQLLTTATGKNPLQITDNAYFRMLGDIQQATKKFRPNELNNPEAVGMLQKLWQVGDELSAGTGTAVDLKDLHILRRGAQAVTQSGANDETKTIARTIVGKIDDFINGLKPGDIAGGADPTQAANALMTGISTWHKASKVAMVEDAIKAADAYKSDYASGLRNAFTQLMKTDEYKNGIFNQTERDAIRSVAKGTFKGNVADLIGKLGVNFNGGVHNILGGGLGTSGLTAALSPVLGPAAFPAALTATTIAGNVGRKAAGDIGLAGAERAAKIMAAQSAIPVAQQAPNVLAQIAQAANLGIRAASPSLLQQLTQGGG